VKEHLIDGREEKYGWNDKRCHDEIADRAPAAEFETGQSIAAHGACECGENGGDGGEKEGVDNGAGEAGLLKYAGEVVESNATPVDAEEAVAGGEEKGGKEVIASFEGGTNQVGEGDEEDRSQEQENRVKGKASQHQTSSLRAMSCWPIAKSPSSTASIQPMALA